MKGQGTGKRTLVFLVVVATSCVVVTLWCADLGRGQVSRRSGRAVRSFEGEPEDEEGERNASSRTKRRGQILRLKLPSIHLRPSQMGIPVGEALDPPLCPPPPVTRSLGICYLEKCTTHHDCAHRAACCFNGCIRTCTDPMDQPAAFDWIEDTSKVLPILGLDFENSPKPFSPVPLQTQSTQYVAAEGVEELVHLPGGCYISADRYQKLQDFMKAPSIEQCRCDDGEMVCDIRKEKA